LSIDQNNTAIKQNSTIERLTYLTIDQNNTAIKQNSTIEQLTYLTIAYLPINLMAVSAF
jgi:hypothetical protein